jgi:hypothetical protein
VGLELAAESIADVGGIEMKRFERFIYQSEGVILGYLFDPIDASVQHRTGCCSVIGGTVR